MNTTTISKSKAKNPNYFRKTIDFPLNMLDTLKKAAEKENRSLTNYIENIIIQHVKDLKK